MCRVSFLAAGASVGRSWLHLEEEVWHLFTEAEAEPRPLFSGSYAWWWRKWHHIHYQKSYLLLDFLSSRPCCLLFSNGSNNLCVYYSFFFFVNFFLSLLIKLSELLCFTLRFGPSEHFFISPVAIVFSTGSVGSSAGSRLHKTSAVILED